MTAKVWNHGGVIARIPNLAIHLGGNDFSADRETSIRPILASTLVDLIMQEDKGNSDKHHPAIMNKIAEDLKVPVKDIVDFELNLVDT